MAGGEGKRVLIVAAHPDDEVLGCAGTTVRHQEQGDEVYALILGEGVTSRYANRASARSEELANLHQALTRVADLMRYTAHWHLDFPDNRFDTVPLLDLVKAVETIKAEVCPDLVYTHFEHDLNIDHRKTFQAVLTATRPKAAEPVKELYSFEIPSSTEWVSPYSSDNMFRPNVFVDVTGRLEKKIEAMKLYDMELAEYPHPRSPEALTIIAQRWGIACGLPMAEAFIQIRNIR